MCGIAGVVTTHPEAMPSESAIVSMRDTLAHRGPDGHGLFREAGVALAHRRLSIVDLALGHQPMFSADGRYAITYNGEVFNHPSLMATLKAAGVEYQTRCDTETILQLFAREGIDAVRQLRGMFAFAIWDRETRTLSIARDRFGVKPLYYVHDSAGNLFFASEIKALLAAGAVKPSLNASAVPDFLANHATSGDETLFEGVRRLPAGHTMTWRNGAISIVRYWDLPAAGSHAEQDERAIIEEYTHRLEESVRLRLMADVPLGVFLSGGIDSAAITALTARMIDAPVKSFSVAFAEREANEFEWARMVAERYRTEHHEITLTPEAFWESVPKLVWHEDEPMAHPSSVALYWVAKLASEHVKVVLTGEGSDETLAGYNRYRVTIFNRRFGLGYESMTPSVVRRAVRRALEAAPKGSRTARRLRRTFLGLPADLESIYCDNFAVFDRRAIGTLLEPSFRARVGSVDPYAAYHAASDARGSSSLLDQMLYADAKTYLHELLMKQDQMSMAASIESRVPFLDHPLVEWVTGLPDRMKLRGTTTKYVLRQAMKELLPAEILGRRKMGFPVPVGAWLRGPYRGVLESVLLHERTLSRGIFAPAEIKGLVARHVGGELGLDERLWTLINFELWQRMFIDGESVEDVTRTFGGRRIATDAPQAVPAMASA